MMAVDEAEADGACFGSDVRMSGGRCGGYLHADLRQTAIVSGRRLDFVWGVQSGSDSGGGQDRASIPGTRCEAHVPNRLRRKFRRITFQGTARTRAVA